MTSQSPRKILNQATTQADRWRDAPAPGRVKVDGRSLAQLLAFAAQYGALINFYDLSDNPDGDWTIFFASDPSIALALLAGLDASALDAEFRRQIEALKAARGFEQRLKALRRVIAAIIRLVRILDNAHRSAGDAVSSAARAVRWEISTALAAPVQRFAVHASVVATEDGSGPDLAGLSSAWGLDGMGTRGGADPTALGSDWIDTIVAVLEDVVAALIAALQRLSEKAAQMLVLSLDSEGHAPQSALYDAFAMLFRHAQANVNRFPRRLVEFYYGDVLKQKSRAQVPDQVYLTFTPAKDVEEADVPKATHFLAGTDAAGQNIDYAAERSLAVYDSAVSALRLLRVSEDTLGAASGKISVRAQALSGVVALADKPPVIAEPFPPFGDPAVGTKGVLTMSAATLGFALASPTLMLTGGSRIVTLKLKVGPQSLTALMPLLKAIGDKAGGLPPMKVLTETLKAGFALSYSTAGGWIAIAGYDVAQTGTVVDRPAVTLEMSFKLDSDAAPFVALETTPPDKSATPPDPGSQVPSETLPVLMAKLKQERVVLGGGGTTIAVYPYSVLSQLALDGLEIAVDVGDFDKLLFMTPNGPADQSQPFALLGSPPVQAGSLAIAAEELFVKRIDDLHIAVDWYGLPATATGFKGYYQGYVVDLDGNSPPPGTVLFDNASFRVDIAVDKPGLWKIDPPEQTKPPEPWPPYLFRTTANDPTPKPDVKVLPTTDFDGLNVVKPDPKEDPPPYYDPAKSAVTITLTEPPYAFGDTLYARNVMAAALRETSLAAACSQQCADKCKPPQEIVALTALADDIQKAANGASDADYRQAVQGALAKALPQMTGTALKFIGDGLDKLQQTVDAAQGAALRKNLSQAVAGETAAKPDLFSKNGDALGGPAGVVANLAKWLDALDGTLGAKSDPAFQRARSVLSAAQQLIAAAKDSTQAAPSAERATFGAALLGAKALLTTPDDQCLKDCIAKCLGSDPSKSFPNAPWLPMASAVTLDYGAASAFPPAPDDALIETFYYLEAFDQVAPVDWTAASGEVPLLPAIPEQGALLIGLSGTPVDLTLLFQMTAGPQGWSSNPPSIAWAQKAAGGWTPLTPPDTLQGDGTNGLQNSGIVSLALAPPPQGDDLLWLKLGVAQDADAFPLLAGLTTNALTAAWVGPGGAASLGTPLPAGTITASDPKLDDIATIDQPLQSFGGRPRVVLRPFWMWMAERLRHKDRGIQDWDYARLALAEFPTLWQVAVVPAHVDDATAAPGCVTVVPVAGPSTPNIGDPREPVADPTLLGEIGALLKTRISPFITLDIANPRYVRITVTADVVFSADDTVAAWIKRLNQELVAWLSPWPPTETLGPRPSDYYSEFAIAEFIRNRPYVVAILSFALSYDPTVADDTWCYLTSSNKHELSGELVKP